MTMVFPFFHVFQALQRSKVIYRATCWASITTLSFHGALTLCTHKPGNDEVNL